MQKTDPQLVHLEFFFGEEPFYYPEELPYLWSEELNDEFQLPEQQVSDASATPPTIYQSLHNPETPYRSQALASILEYAKINAISSDRVLPKKFYQILLILAELKIKQIEGNAMNDWLSNEQKEQIHNALSEKWLDPDSRSALELLG